MKVVTLTPEQIANESLEPMVEFVKTLPKGSALKDFLETVTDSLQSGQSLVLYSLNGTSK